MQPLPVGTLVAGKLRIVRGLGIGGMGAVYEVEHELTKHRRALKMLHAEMLAHPSIVTRFEREASAAGRISNPHIVESFDAGKLESGEPYLVMEMLHGEPLAALMERKQRLSIGEMVDIIGQACDGVQAAHDAGIVHRDLKPDNLFLLERGGRPFVKILDFGISKFDPSLTGGHGMTHEGAAMGTPYYMSPEQVAGDPRIDARTDVYALGIILYECASGRKPFDADALTALAVLIHEGRPTPLSTLRPDLPAAFVEVVHRAMAKDRDRRFATVRELGAALSAFAGVADAGVPLQTAAAPKVGAPVNAATNGAVSLSVPGVPAAKTKSRGGIVAAGIALIVVLGGGTFALRALRGHSEPARAEPLSASPASPATNLPLATPASVVTPLEALPSAPAKIEAATAAPSPAAPTPVSSAARITVPSKVPSHVGGPPPPPPSPASPASRVDQKGLAKDNPFK